MSDVTVVHAEPEPAVEAAPIAEVAAAVEPVADAAVEVAEIEANRDVAIAEIHAETEEHIVEAQAEATSAIVEQNTELEQCRTQIADLTLALETERNERLSIQTRLSDLEKRSENVQDVLIEGEVIPEEQLKEPEPEPEPPRRNSHRWI